MTTTIPQPVAEASSMLITREFTDPTLAAYVQDVDEQELKQAVADYLEDKVFENAAREALASERAQNALGHFAEHFDPHSSHPEAKKL